MSGSALEGIKVIDFGRMVAGPYCAKMLGDLGADVIKVEGPGGDPSRRCGPFPNDERDPEQSALFLYLNTSKRSITLDLGAAGDLETFKGLVEWADVLVDNHAPEVLEGAGLGWESLRALNPRLVYTSITPYGRTGPRANAKGDELTLIHAAGLGNLMPVRSTSVDRAPVKLGGYQVGYHGGLAAALATMGALFGRDKNGTGQLADVSLQQAMIGMIAPMMPTTRYHGTTWRRVPDRPPAMGRMKTKDGYIILNAFDDHHFAAFQEIMGNPEWCAGEEWKSMAYRAHHIKDIGHLIDEWMLTQSKHEIHHRAAKAGIPIGPINSAEDVMNNPQFAEREFFTEVEHPRAGKHRYAGWPYKLPASPPRVSRPAPLLGEHGEEIKREIWGAAGGGKDAAESAGFKGSAKKLPLEGVKVLEFCWVWAGPYCGMLLADLGAEVIKVEGHNRTDLTRRSVVWPLADAEPTSVPPNQGLAFNAVNLNKKSLTLDLRKPEGLELALKMAAEADVVVDNMRPGALIKLGLGYEELSKLKEDIIVASSSGRGHQGKEKQYLGYAMVHQGIGGTAYITGYPDDHPSHSLGDVDIMNAHALAYSILAAMHYRGRTGEGQFIDFSQCEGVSSLIGEVLLGYEMTGVVPERMGNAHPTAAPHAVYRAWGVDRWLAIEAHDDEEFGALAKVIGRPELASDEKFATCCSRKKNEAELDAIIEGWTKDRDRDWMAAELTSAGVAAAPSREALDIYADPHVRERGGFLKIDHPEIGEIELVGPPWKLSDVETPTRHAPCLGEHNDEVLKGWLGLDDARLAELRAGDVIL